MEAEEGGRLGKRGDKASKGVVVIEERKGGKEKERGEIKEVSTEENSRMKGRRNNT